MNEDRRREIIEEELLRNQIRERIKLGLNPDPDAKTDTDKDQEKKKTTSAIKLVGGGFWFVVCVFILFLSLS